MNFIVNFLFFVFAFQADAQNWSSVYQQNKSSIPIIVSSGAICSGALIEKNLILTSAHCVDHYRSISVYFYLSEWIRLSASRVQLLESSDLALIQIEKDVQLPVLKIFPQDQLLVEGQSIATIGHPIGGSIFRISSLLRSDYLHVISSGLISKVGKSGFVSDMSVSPGNSGGPVFDQKGQIVGVVSKKRIDRFTGDLGFISNHKHIHQLIDNNKSKKIHSESFLNARTSADLYLLYSQPNFRKNRQGDSKTYWNVGLGIQLWDRLRFSLDTNLDTKEAFTQYGIGWNFHIQAEDPLQHYKLLPAIEVIKFRFRDPLQNELHVQKLSTALSISLKPSWFPIYAKLSAFEVDNKSYGMVGLGLLF